MKLFRKYYLLPFLFLLFTCNTASDQEDAVVQGYILKNRKLLESGNYSIVPLPLDKAETKLAARDTMKWYVLREAFHAQSLGKGIPVISEESTFIFHKLEQEIKQARRKDLEVWRDLANLDYYYRLNFLKEGIPLLARIRANLKHAGGNHTFDRAYTYMMLGFYLDTLGETEDAFGYLEKASKYARNTDPALLPVIYDNLGRYAVELGRLSEAHFYLERALGMARNQGNINREARIYGDLSRIYVLEQQHEEAIALLEKDIDLSIKDKDERNLAFALKELASVYQLMGKPEQTKSYALQALTYVGDQNVPLEYEILNLLVGVSYEQKAHEEELQYRRKLEALRETATQQGLETPEIIAQARWQLKQLDDQYDLQDESNRKMRSSTNLHLAAVLGILIVLFLLLYMIQRYRNLRKWQFQRFEFERKLKKENEISVLKNKDLKNRLGLYVSFLREKSEEVELLKSKIEDLEKAGETHDIQRLKKLNEILDSHLMTDENWYSFKKQFVKEYPEYYSRIISEFPELTESNLRLVILNKMGLSPKESAMVLGVSYDAVKKAKQRLKKSLSAKRYDELFMP